MRPAAPAVLAAAALALCGACSTTTPRQAAPAPSAGQAAPATSTTSSTCIGADYSLAPGGYCIYPAKVAWPSSAVLAVDPSTLDWTDPDTVASAYITTLGTWDTQVDASTAYATHRAAIFTTTARTTAAGTGSSPTPAPCAPAAPRRSSASAPARRASP